MVLLVDNIKDDREFPRSHLCSCFFTADGPDLSGKGFGARVGPYNEFDKMHKKKQFSHTDYVSARKTLAEHNTHWPKSKEKVINDVWLTAFRWVALAAAGSSDVADDTTTTTTLVSTPEACIRGCVWETKRRARCSRPCTGK
jgi:hypothetical protein